MHLVLGSGREQIFDIVREMRGAGHREIWDKCLG